MNNGGGGNGKRQGVEGSGGHGLGNIREGDEARRRSPMPACFDGRGRDQRSLFHISRGPKEDPADDEDLLRRAPWNKRMARALHCDMCGEDFEEADDGWTEAKARAEMDGLFPDVPIEDCAIAQEKDRGGRVMVDEKEFNEWMEYNVVEECPECHARIPHVVYKEWKCLCGKLTVKRES